MRKIMKEKLQLRAWNLMVVLKTMLILIQSQQEKDIVVWYYCKDTIDDRANVTVKKFIRIAQLAQLVSLRPHQLLTA